MFLWNLSTMSPLPMYACFFMSGRTLNQVPLPLSGSPPVDLPNLNVFVLPTTLVRALAPVFFLLPPHLSGPCPRCSSSGPPCLCCVPVVIIIACTILLPLSPLISLVCLCGPLLFFRDLDTVLSEMSEFDQPSFVYSCTKGCGRENGGGNKERHTECIS